jgi:hypothetical protein
LWLAPSIAATTIDLASSAYVDINAAADGSGGGGGGWLYSLRCNRCCRHESRSSRIGMSMIGATTDSHDIRYDSLLSHDTVWRWCSVSALLNITLSSVAVSHGCNW